MSYAYPEGVALARELLSVHPISSWSSTALRECASRLGHPNPHSLQETTDADLRTWVRDALEAEGEEVGQ